MEVDWSAVDKKWQKKWAENNDHETDVSIKCSYCRIRHNW